MKIQAEILAHSKNNGIEIITYKLTFPRIILAEFLTHRKFSRNSSSSRAVPFEKMLESVTKNPFIPIAFQKAHKGMQGNEYLTSKEAEKNWIDALDFAVQSATKLHNTGVTKQLCNRLLEPFMWQTVIVTTTMEGLDNFLNLRLPNYELINQVGFNKRFKSKKEVINYMPNMGFEEYKTTDWLSINIGQAEIHISDLAEQMYDAYNESEPLDTPTHVPYFNEIYNKHRFTLAHFTNIKYQDKVIKIPTVFCISAMMCARVSYTTIGNDMQDWSVDKYIEKFTELINSTPAHSSPFEHIAIFEKDNKDYYNLTGWKSLRYILEKDIDSYTI